MALDTLIDTDDKDVSTFGPVTVFKHYKTVDRSYCNYRNFISNGIPLPILPYSAYESRHNTPLGFYMLYDEKVLVTASSVGGFLDFDIEASAAIAKQKAAKQFFSNLSSQNFNASVALGELPQTLGMIGNTARRLAGSFSSLRRLDIHGAFNQLKMSNYSHRQSLFNKAKKDGLKKGEYKSNLDFAANAWLEMKYGWKPLLADIDGAAKALAEKQEKDSADIKVSGTGKERIDVSTRNVPGWSIVGGGAGMIKVHHYAYFKLLDSSHRNAQRLGFANLNEVAWELIPYSFVVDWFIPVGSYIQALNAGSGLEPVRQGTSTKMSLSGSGSCLEVNGDVANFSETLSIRQFTRTASSPGPGDLLGVKSLDKVLNLDKTVTSLALLKQAFS